MSGTDDVIATCQNACMPILQIVQEIVAKEGQIMAACKEQRVPHKLIIMLHFLIVKNSGVNVCAQQCSLLGNNPHWPHELKIKSWPYTDAWQSFFTGTSKNVSML